MPRVESHTKSNRGGEAKCGRAGCGKVIQPGEQYFSFSFFRGARQYRCKDHRPRQSELTQTAMADAYAGIETVEDAIAANGGVDDIKTALEEAVSQVEAARDQYQDSYDNLPENFQNADMGSEIQEKIDALESFADILNGAVSDIDGIDTAPADGEDEEEKEEAVLAEAIDFAENAIAEFAY